MDPTSILLLAAAAAAFFFLIIRPQRKRQAAQKAMQKALAPGAEIMTSAGIFGTVAAVSDDQISVEISPGVFLRLLPAAVSRVIEEAPESQSPVDLSKDTPPSDPS